jgi:hypothetical protein
MPVIRHRTGPLAGREKTLDPVAERITIGRDPETCEVVYPADFTQVARRHFAIVRRPSGAWTLDPFGTPYVAINGTPAVAGQALESGDVVELGKPGGASFEFFAGGKNITSVLPATEAQHKMENPYRAVGRTRQLVLVALAVGVVGIAASMAYSFYQGRGAARLDKAIADLSESQRKAAADSIGPAVRERLLQASHLMMVVNAAGQFMGGGTGFPIGPDVFGTNAHVAEMFNELKDGQKMLVRAPGANGKTYEVVSISLHPGFSQFKRYLQEDPLYVTTSRNCLECRPVELGGSLAYDVALVRVKPGSNIGPPLEIASRADLEAIAPGLAVGLAGYPMESVQGREVMGFGASPNLRTGMVSSVTDMFNMPGESAHRHLLAHNIPITGGNSGSPMVNADGKLVALLNSANMFRNQDGARMPHGAIINYGQRADLLRDLLEGRAEAAMREAELYWAKQTANFARGSEYLMPWLAEQAKPKDSTVQVVAEFKGKLTKADAFTTKNDKGVEVTLRQKIQSVTLKANVPGLLVAYGRGKGLKLYAVVDGNIAAKDDRDGMSLVRIPYKLDKDVTADIYVLGGDDDIEYQLNHYSFSGGAT